MINVHEFALVLLRVVTGFIIWQHGARKLLGLFGGAQQAGFVPVEVAGAVEFVGGAALAAGFLTRPFALILAVDMAILYVTRFLPEGFPPIVNRQGEVTCLLVCVSVLLAFTGPGRASVDHVAAVRMRAREPLAAWRDHAPAALGIIRVLMGFLFFCYGLRKMFGLLGEAAEPFLALQWFAGVIELIGGAALIVGFLTRPIAFLCSGEMAFAYFINHNPRGFFPILNGGERAALFCFYFLFLFVAGPGRWSVDGVMRGRTQKSDTAVAC